MNLILFTIFLLQLVTMLNIEFQPITRPRNYAPERTFVTKWDVEIDRNRVKKINRARDRTAKYFDDFNEFDDFKPRVHFKECEDIIDCAWELDSNDGDETHSGWLRTIRDENAYYDANFDNEWYDMISAELDSDQRKRPYEFQSDQSLFKRPRA